MYIHVHVCICIFLLTLSLPLSLPPPPSLSPEEVCYVTVPAILGLSRALKGTSVGRATDFREMCGLVGGGEVEEGGEGGEDMKELKLGSKEVTELKEMVSYM